MFSVKDSQHGFLQGDKRSKEFRFSLLRTAFHIVGTSSIVSRTVFSRRLKEGNGSFICTLSYIALLSHSSTCRDSTFLIELNEKKSLHSWKQRRKTLVSLVVTLQGVTVFLITNYRSVRNIRNLFECSYLEYQSFDIHLHWTWSIARGSSLTTIDEHCYKEVFLNVFKSLLAGSYFRFQDFDPRFTTWTTNSITISRLYASLSLSAHM